MLFVIDSGAPFTDCDGVITLAPIIGHCKDVA